MSVGGEKIVAESPPTRQTPICRSCRRSLYVKASPAEGEPLHDYCPLEQTCCEYHHLQLLLGRCSSLAVAMLRLPLRGGLSACRLSWIMSWHVSVSWRKSWQAWQRSQTREPPRGGGRCAVLYLLSTQACRETTYPCCSGCPFCRVLVA